MVHRLLTEAEPDLGNTSVAFALCIAAGMCTVLGASLVCVPQVVQLASKPVLAIGLALAAGMMTYASCMDIWVKSYEAFLEEEMSEADAYLVATLCFFGGMLLMRLLAFFVDWIDPHHHVELDLTAVAAYDRQQSPAENAEAEQGVKKNDEVENALKAMLKRMGLNTALAIAFHNMPEGLATFVGYLADESVGVALAIGIGFHNIPEGLCVALPIYYATGSRIKGFLWAFLSGVSEPIGALIGWGVVKSTGDDMRGYAYGILFGLVAGMMIMISILELFPTAFRYDPKNRFATTAAVVGMAGMATSLCLFQY